MNHKSDLCLLNFWLQSTKSFIYWAKRIFTPVAVLFLSYFAWRSKELLIHIFQNAQTAWLFISAGLYMVLHLIAPLFTLSIFKSRSLQLSYWQLLLIHIQRLPARYMPGGIWHTVARAIDYHQQGISSGHIGKILMLENLIVAAVTFILGGSIVARLPNHLIWTNLAGLSSACAMVTVIVMPWAIKKYFLSPQYFSKNQYLLSLFYVFIFWLIAASSFICFLHSFSELTVEVTLIEAAGIYIFSWGIGFISIFAPQGIGVAEYVSSQLLTSNITSSSFIALLASFRVLVFIADITTWLLAKLFYKII